MGRMARYALFPGCVMSTEQYGYEVSLKTVLPVLGVEIVDLEGFSCCGEPLKSINQMLTLTLSARNIAICEKEGLDILAPCPLCHLALSETKRILDNDPKMRERAASSLANEELKYRGTSKIYHIIDLLHDIIGLEAVKEKVVRPLSGLNFATHYGCHLIRPSEMGRPVDSENPQKMERILEVLGAGSAHYPEKPDCCGGPLLPVHPETSLTKTGQKLKAVQDQGFSGMSLCCPWCHKMFDSKQKKAGETVGAKLNVPVLYITQLVGLAFGIDPGKLGLELNLSPVDRILGGQEEAGA
ncbi:MAG: CoB--CoM heterodisulfide reductase iron-sulfur subunit B family protein [Candidatus Thermoplasmatota archaeon]|nr:CoB--CoM heterodisulfide reductase iron-sulfur subunit B family protein [Candidatus Thermoplasmatota archaeon]